MSGPVHDVCVVGAGPAGLATALTLAETGRSVLMLESGGWTPSAAADELADGDHAGVSYVGLGGSRRRQIGGTANIWSVEYGGEPGAKYVPLDERDLAQWPLAWRDLEPHYVEAQALCGLGPFAYDAEGWATNDRHPFLLHGTSLTSKIYQFGSAARFTDELPSRLGEFDGVSVVPSTTVVRLEVDRRRVATVATIDGEGRSGTVEARLVVLACGAVENARLLMLSDSSVISGWLGAGFMEHARDFSMALDPAGPDIFTAAAFYDAHEAHDGTVIGGRLAFTEEALDEGGLPNASLTLFPRPRPVRTVGARLRRRFSAGWTGTGRGPYGWSRVRQPDAVYRDFKLILNLEQRPDSVNRIELANRSDRFGNPLPRLTLGWSAQEQRELDTMRAVVADSLAEAGIGQLRWEEGVAPDLSAHHHAGTTRMGESSDDGVVDPHGQVFGLDNLFMAGASVFPTAGFANPMLTIVAMGVRLGRHLDTLL